MGFRVPWAVFRFPKPRIPDSTNKTDIPDSRIPIPLHGAIKEVIVQNCKWLIAMKRNKTDGNLPKHNLQTWPYLLGWLLHKSLIECFWHVRRLAPSPSRGLKQADQLQCLCVFLITNVTFSLAHVNIASSLQQQLLLNALKRNFALFKTDFKFLTSPHQNSIKKGRISFVWNPSSKIVFGKKVRLAYIIVYFFCPMKNNGCRLIMFYFLE